MLLDEKLFNIKTYVLHCKTLSSRKEHMLFQFEKHNFSNFEFYEQFDADELSDNDIQKYYVCDAKHERHRGGFHKLSLPEISLTIKHYEVYRKIVDRSDDYCIVMEDDSLLSEDFSTKFFAMYEQAPPSYDFIFISSGCNLHIDPLEENKLIYPKSHPATRCTGAMVVKKEACKKLLDTMVPFHMVIDWELNHQLYLHNFNVYWAEPTIVEQGSESGFFKSALR
tara:strand:+ start:4598 stop:5269 length:672 start_codon:yes stop_codon:yes gene_type:complete